MLAHVMGATGASSSLYDRLGGEVAIMAAVDLFYAKVLADPITKPFFDGVDMEVQVRKQVAFMTRAFGGPAAQLGKDLRESHAKLVKDRGLGDVHFDAVALHLGTTLDELGVTVDLRTEALALIESTRTQVLNR